LDEKLCFPISKSLHWELTVCCAFSLLLQALLVGVLVCTSPSPINPGSGRDIPSVFPLRGIADYTTRDTRKGIKRV